jgi:hypothetical protein
MKPKKRPFLKLIEEECPESPFGDPHLVWLALAGEADHPAECVSCGAWADDVPDEVYAEL